MTSGVMHASPEALDHLREVLEDLRRTTEGAFQSIQEQLRRRLGTLDARINVLEHEVRHIRYKIETCPEEEWGDLSNELAGAEECLSRMRFHQDQVSNALGSYRREGAELTALLQLELPRAIAHLQRKSREITEYSSLSISDFGADRSASTAGTTSAVARGITLDTRNSQEHSDLSVSELQTLSQLPLPVGFQWIPLRKISADDCLRSDETFPKVPEVEMRRGLNHLRTHVLPALRKKSDTGSEYFFAHDQEEGLEYQHGTQRAFEAFFGNEPIVLTRLPEGGFGVTNGRHRIHVARAEGWVALPVRVI